MKGAKIATALICILFGFFWLYAALSKLTDYENFRVQMGKSPMLTGIASTLAWAVPATEISIAYLLLYKRTRLLALYASLYLMVMFTTYLILILKYSYYIPCSCGGILGKLPWDVHIVFNLLFAGLATTGILLMKRIKDGSTVPKYQIDRKLAIDYQHR